MKKLMLFILFGTIGLIGLSTYRKRDLLEVQQGISKELIRFHVRANSDSDEDQALKLKVKDEVITYLQPLLKESGNLEESRKILQDNMEEITEIALLTLRENGSDYGVNVYFEKSYFPMKTYGDITLPPGEYEAFRIDIGESFGKNWWCVLYPPLCFVDATHGSLPDSSKEELKNLLTQEEYHTVSQGEKKVVVQFKYLTFLNEFFNK